VFSPTTLLRVVAGENLQRPNCSSQINNDEKIAFLSCLALSGCSLWGGTEGTISVVNNSPYVIDSVVIIANKYQVRFYKIPPHGTSSRTIGKGLIKGDHDISMFSTIYIQHKAIKGNYFYNDLSGFNGDYKMQIDSSFKTEWVWNTKY
jgi:hypothetical protein